MIGVRPPAFDPEAAHRQATTLPVGRPATVRAYVTELARRHRRDLALLVAVNAVAVGASMVGPYLLGGLVQDLSHGHRDVHLGRTLALFCAALAVQTVFVRTVRMRGAMLGGLLLGLFESLGTGYLGELTGGVFGSNYQDVFAFLVLIAVLVFRPSGLLGERIATRA